MTKDERHLRSHDTAEQEIGDILWDIFADSERTCRADVLLKLLHTELMAMDNVEDVADTVSTMTGIILARTFADRELYNAAGHA
jgi:hypothetical protein